MTRTQRLLIGGCVGLAASLLTVQARPQTQEPACLHGVNEAPEQLARRRAAIGFARQVNTLQLRAFSTAGAYAPFAQLPLASPAPEGWKVVLAADAASYSFSIVDSTDPCRFGLFSNHEGLIYRGEPMR